MFTYPFFKVSTLILSCLSRGQAKSPFKNKGPFCFYFNRNFKSPFSLSHQRRGKKGNKKGYTSGSPRREAFKSFVDHPHFLDYQEKFVRFSLLRSNYFSRGTGVLARYTNGAR